MKGCLRRLTLVNFRSHRKTELVFDGRPVAILGRNGVGKTNFLEAISLFTPGRGLRRAERDQLASSSEMVGWKLMLEGELDKVPFFIANQARLSEARQTLINDKISTQTGQGQFLRIVWMVPSMDRVWIDSASERRKFFDRIVLSFNPEHGENVLAYERAMRDRNRLLKDDVSDETWYQVVEGNMAEMAEKIIKARSEAMALLNAEMAETKSAFPKGKLSLVYERFGESADEWRMIFQEGRRQDRFSGTTNFGPHKLNVEAVLLEKNQKAALCSTGEQKALLIALILANARALIDQDRFVVVLLDEAVAHLDERRRADLFDELCALDAHIFMTGTEAGLFTELGDRGEYIEFVEENGESLIKC